MTQNKDEDPPSRQAIRAQIDENLKRVYTTALNEELPDRFRDLLAQLKAKEPNPGSGTDSGSLS
jgi:Anti-sigma factor NepR